MNSINLQQRKKVLVKQKNHQKNCTLTHKMINSSEGQKHIECKNFSFVSFVFFFRYFVSISCPPFTYFVYHTTLHICYKSISSSSSSSLSLFKSDWGQECHTATAVQGPPGGTMNIQSHGDDMQQKAPDLRIYSTAVTLIELDDDWKPTEAYAMSLSHLKL